MPAPVKGRVISPAGAPEPDPHAAEATAGTSAADTMVLDDDVDVAVAGIVDVDAAVDGALEDEGGDARVGVVVSTTASDGRATEVVGTEAPLLEHAPTAQATTASTTIR